MFSREVTEHGYITYPRRFEGYKWYKSIILSIAFIVFFVIFMNISVIVAGVATGNLEGLISSAKGGYDTLDAYTLPGCLTSLAPIAMVIPALMIAAVIVKDRPFSSYSSSRGGWNWKIFLKSLIPAIVIVGIPAFFIAISEKGDHVVKFTVAGLIAATILTPLQCVGEEYLFRGIIMQTVGAWFRIPILAIIVQVILFGMVHPYNIIGVLSVSVTALCFGIITHLTKGLEASSAAHMVNNLIAFYTAGFGLSKIQTDVAVRDLVLDFVVLPVYMCFIIYVNKKYHWYDEVKKDDVARFNEKKQKKATHDK